MKKHKLINFDNLMKLYEFNYYLIENIFRTHLNGSKLSTFVANQRVLQYEPITVPKHTSIFKLYYKFRNFRLHRKEYHIKPHIIFTLYNDAKLLEAKTIKQSKEFGCSIKDKFKTNLKVFFWLKSYNKKLNSNIL